MVSYVVRRSGQHNHVDQNGTGGAAVGERHHGADQKSGEGGARAVSGSQHRFPWHPYVGLWQRPTT